MVNWPRGVNKYGRVILLTITLKVNGRTVEIITKQEAKHQGLKRYFTGKPCRHGHVSPRLVSTGKCDKCHRIYHDKYIVQWQKDNAEKVNSATRKWREVNPEAAKQTHDKYYATNKEKKLKYMKWWRTVNNDKQIAYNAKRRAQIKQALPAWADVDKINEIYKQSVTISADTGIVHHVDHIIPLGGELVCGLHVHENLQVLVGEDNMSKGNKFAV